jgi:hypothetical protein
MLFSLRGTLRLRQFCRLPIPHRSFPSFQILPIELLKSLSKPSALSSTTLFDTQLFDTQLFDTQLFDTRLFDTQLFDTSIGL